MWWQSCKMLFNYLAARFGAAGRAIGDLAGVYAGFQADRERLELAHAERIKAAGADQVTR